MLCRFSAALLTPFLPALHPSMPAQSSCGRLQRHTLGNNLQSPDHTYHTIFTDSSPGYPYCMPARHSQLSMFKILVYKSPIPPNMILYLVWQMAPYKIICFCHSLLGCNGFLLCKSELGTCHKPSIHQLCTCDPHGPQLIGRILDINFGVYSGGGAVWKQQ